MPRKANTRKKYIRKKDKKDKKDKTNTRKKYIRKKRKQNTRKRLARGTSPILDTLKTISVTKNPTLELYLYKKTMKKMTQKRFFDKTIENSIRYLVEKTNNHTLEKILNRIISNTSHDDNVVLCKFLFEIIEGVDVTKKRNFNTTFCRCVNTLTEIMKAWGNIDNKNPSIKTPSLSGGGGGKRIIIILIILALLYFIYTSISFAEKDVTAIVGTMKNRKDVVVTQAGILTDIFKRIHGPQALESLAILFNKHFSFNQNVDELQYEEYESPLAIEDGETKGIALPSPIQVGETKGIVLPSQRQPVITDEPTGLALLTQDIVPFKGIETLKTKVTLVNPAQVPVLVSAHIQANLDSFFTDASKLIAELLEKKKSKCTEEIQLRAPETSFELFKRGVVEVITGGLLGEVSSVSTRLQEGLDDCIERNQREFRELSRQLDELMAVSKYEAKGLAKDVRDIVLKSMRGAQSVYYGIGIASTLILFIYNMRYFNN